MVAFSNPGAYFNTAKVLPRWIFTAANFTLVDNSAAAVVSSASTFWTDVAIRGAAVDTNWTGGVKKTLLTVNGPAILQAIIGPTSAAADTDIYEVIVDGVTWTSTAITSGVGLRTYIGYTGNQNLFGTTNTTDYLGVPSASAQSTSSGARSVVGTVVYLPGPSIEMIGAPLVYATQSLVVSITHSASLTTTTNQERQAGVIYRVL